MDEWMDGWMDDGMDGSLTPFPLHVTLFNTFISLVTLLLKTFIVLGLTNNLAFKDFHIWLLHISPP